MGYKKLTILSFILVALPLQMMFMDLSNISKHFITYFWTIILDSSLRWPSFRMSNRLSQSGTPLQISSQSAGQLSLLQKFSLLRLTAIMEKYSMSNKHGWTW